MTLKVSVMRIIRAIQAAVLATVMVSGSAWAALGEDTIDALRMLWQSQDKALDGHDLDGVMATFADSDDIMLMGTGPGEHWVGKAEISDAYSNIMKNFEANTLETKCTEGAGSSMGDVVWFTAVCTISRTSEGNDVDVVMNVSAVIVKQGEDWRFHTMHFSHLLGASE